ncbi:3-keto-5-aminohexanoate cleavage protein [uncultured Tateyamaria sp.]|uniref:3-keto-5-aminohexanoate cleavage protein n=1 Tax=uncultured Tateyamaria sp. TaxID=455651 RepID=UPI0026341077|nr:3-keto-5-aminohexanoate cleavage protein [uncultured Tateyamaria sp.]
MQTSYELMVAPTGARLTKADHPALPITAPEIAATAQACQAAGATAIHVHVRDGQGRHALAPDLYAAALDHIARVSDIHVQVSTEAAGVFDPQTQMECLAAVPARDASVALRELSGNPNAYVTAQTRGVDVQHILYTPDEVTALLQHFDKAEIPEQSRRAIFVLGRYSDGPQSDPRDLAPFVNAMGDAGLRWSACAFGAQEHACMLAALDLGGQVRIGFENSYVSADGTVYPDNATSVSAFVAAADARGFQPGGAST